MENLEEIPLDSYSLTKDNSISFIRLLAAFQVMYGHMIGHLNIESPFWIGKILSVVQGVPIFFTLSGFLIWFSMERSMSYSQYLKKRMLRIYPELWMAVIFEIITIIILYRPPSIRDVCLFTVTQATFLQFWTPDSLRGYGIGTPNGSLWTICTFAQFYMVAWLIYRILKNRDVKIWIITICMSIAASMGLDVLFEGYGGIIYKLYCQTAIRYLWMFLFGMFVAKYFDSLIEVLRKGWWIWLVLSAALHWTEFDLYAGYFVFSTLFILLSVLGFAYRYPSIKVSPDISYGLYIYHMTVVNILVTLGMMGKFRYFILAFIISSVIAYCSFFIVGCLGTVPK